MRFPSKGGSPVIGFSSAKRILHHPPVRLVAHRLRWILKGHLARHIRRMRGIYAPRRQALLGALETHGAGWLETIPSTTGLHLSARLTGPVTLDRLADAAMAAGVVIERLDRYALSPGAGEAAGFGYGLDAPEVIVDSIRRIARELGTGSDTRSGERGPGVRVTDAGRAEASVARGSP